MKKLFTLFTAIIILQSCQKVPDEIDSVAGMPDVPIMDGFTSKKERSGVFDTISGKIVESTAIGSATDAEVKKFYQDIMPHLGWAEADEMVFLKEDEQVKITSTQGLAQTRVHYYLSPSDK